MSRLLDLKQNSGLDINLDLSANKLIFGAGLTSPQAAIRTIREMQEVLMDKTIEGPRDLYFMYRDVHRISDQLELEKNKLRYDVTLIKPDCLGRELMKTAGHYHPGSFPELYEIVAGRALCLLQKPGHADFSVIEDVILAQAKAGEKIVIPPGYGHILINPGPGHLVTSNWVSSCFNSEYGLYKKAGGAAYYAAGPAEKPEFIKNPFFKQLPPIKFVRPAQEIKKFGLVIGLPIYPIISNDAIKLDFLNNPEKYDYQDVFIGI